MKKISMLLIAFIFLLGATIVIAKDTKGDKNFSQPLKVKKEKVKHFGKKQISDSDRKKADLLESMINRGKSVSLPTVSGDPSIGGATGVLGAPLPAGGKKYAIVIGLSNYPGADSVLPDLCVRQVPESDLSVYDPEKDGIYTSLEDEIKANCKDGDSVTMEKTLVEKYGFAPSNVFRFSDSEATFSKIEEKVNYIKGILKAEDELVFFFSGHGAMSSVDVDGDPEIDDGGIVIYDEKYDVGKYMDTTAAYIDPETDISYSNYKTYYDTVGYDDSAYIWDGQLRDWFANVPTKRLFFAFDTCNAAQMDDLEEIVSPTVNGIGRVLAFSSGKNESSYTYYRGGEENSGNIHDGEGLFSHYFVLRSMWDGLADGSNPLKKTNPLKKDGKVSVEEAFSYAYPLVREGSTNQQTPVLRDFFVNDLLLGTPPVLVKTIYVYANKSTETASYALQSGVKYLVEASKIATAGGTIRFDAKYSTNTATGGTIWTDVVDASYPGYTSDSKLLELFMNGAAFDWGAYNKDHVYKKEVNGSVVPSVKFKINDTVYTDNSESLTVKIFKLN
jgi:hypothetical protein